jgi:hypothetical protein
MTKVYCSRVFCAHCDTRHGPAYCTRDEVILDGNGLSATCADDTTYLKEADKCQG